MQGGRLRHRVTVQNKSESRNEYGEPVYTWNDVKTVWASVEPLSARENLEARTTLQETTTRIRMRAWGDVNPEQRAVWETHVYDIESVIRPLENNREMILLCNEVI